MRRIHSGGTVVGRGYMGDLTAHLSTMQGAVVWPHRPCRSALVEGELETPRRPNCRVHGETLLLFELNDYILC